MYVYLAVYGKDQFEIYLNSEKASHATFIIISSRANVLKKDCSSLNEYRLKLVLLFKNFGFNEVFDSRLGAM